MENKEAKSTNAFTNTFNEVKNIIIVTFFFIIIFTIYYIMYIKIEKSEREIRMLYEQIEIIEKENYELSKNTKKLLEELENERIKSKKETEDLLIQIRHLSNERNKLRNKNIKLNKEVKELYSKIQSINKKLRIIDKMKTTLRSEINNEKANTIAKVMVCEGGNSYHQLKLVASVILNRSRSRTLENLYETISAKNQFECFKKLPHVLNKEMLEKAKSLVTEMSNGNFKPITDAKYFYNPKIARKTPSFAKKLPLKLKYGGHLYY